MATLRHAWRENLAVEGLTVQSDAPPEWAPAVTVHRPLAGPQISTGLTGLARTGTLRVWCPDHGARNRVLLLAAYGDPLHLTDVCGPDRLDDLWLAVTRLGQDKPAPNQAGLWLDLDYAQVGPPGGPAPEPWTYADLAASAADYTAAQAPFSTYDALWYGPVPAEPAPAVFPT
jgi:hypothetical protein